MTYWYWLSFVKDETDTFAGVALIEVPDELDEDNGMIYAVRRAWQLGLNPGGQVAGKPFDAATWPYPEPLAERLMPPDEARALIARDT